MTSTDFLPFVITVGGMLLYHLSQKSIPRTVNPFVGVIIAYAVGIAVCAIGALVLPRERPLLESVRQSNWAVPAMGAAAACIEIGFMLAYRAGWKISIAAVATNAAVTAMLVPIGLIIYKDQLSARNLLGLLFCIVGMVLVVRD